MPFSILVDDPNKWGCKHILIMVSTHEEEAELVIPPSGVAEANLVPWQDHVGKQVRVRWRDDEGRVSHPLPIYVDSLRTFSIAGVDRRRVVNQTARSLRAMAIAEGKHYWQVFVVAGPPKGRRRILWRPPLEFSDREAAFVRINADVLSFFTPGGGLKIGDLVNIFILSADAVDGLPPTIEELGYANAIFRFGLTRIGGDPARFPGRHLVTLVKVTGTPNLAGLLFFYDPWEDDRSAWMPTRPNAAMSSTPTVSPPVGAGSSTD